MFRAALTTLLCALVYVITTDMGFTPIPKIGLICSVILLMYFRILTNPFWEEYEAKHRRADINCTNSEFIIGNTDDELLKGYEFLWED